MLSYALFAYGLPRGRVFQTRIEGLEGFADLTTASENVTRAVHEFTHPDVESSEKATAVALGEKVKRSAPAPRDTTVTVLNGNGVDRLGVERGLPARPARRTRCCTPPNGLPANAPHFDYFRTQVYFDPRDAARAAGGAEGREPLRLGGAEARCRAQISQLANGAMLTVVVGQTFHGKLASAPIDQTPKRQRANVVFAPSASIDLLRQRRRAVHFPLMVPTVIERSSWTDSERPLRMYWIDPDEKHKAVRLVYRMGSNEYWGVQMTRLGRRAGARGQEPHAPHQGPPYDLYYNGPKLHMVVLRTPQGALLGREHAARPAVERDDARDREGPEAARRARGAG